MPPLLIAATTPDDPGFLALRSESLAQHFNMLRRLAENWQSGKNRFSAPGEKLLGAFVGGQLVGVCGLNVDPFSPQLRTGRIRHLYISDAFVGGKLASSCWWPSSPTPAPGLIFSTLMRRRRRGRFMNRLDFARFMMSRGSLIACSVRFKRGWPGENARVTVPGPGHSPAPLS